MPEQYLRFNNKHIGSILTGEKTLTARYDFGRNLTVGEPIDLVGEDDTVFATAVVDRVETQTVEEFYQNDPDGHRSYASLEAFIGVLEQYYPAAGITADSPLTVIYYSDVTPAAPMEWYRKGDLEALLDALEEELQQEDMDSQSPEAVIEVSFQRIREELSSLPELTTEDVFSGTAEER